MRNLVIAAVLASAACGSSDGADTAAWMTDLDDARSLASLAIPGTHDSGARFEPYEGIAKTQELTLQEQLDAGVRYFDIRCHDDSDELLIFHGSIDQNQTFDEVLVTMSAFLAAHPGEAVIMSIKEEGNPIHATRPFLDTLDTYFPKAPFVTGTDIPALGDVRGKIVLLRRFDAPAPLGIDATDWPDNNPQIFSIDPDLRVQDYYQLPDAETKWSLIRAMLDEARAGAPMKLYLNYTSGFTLQDNSLPSIPSVSDAVNAHLDEYLAAAQPARLGVLAMDHVTAERVAAVIALDPP